MPRGRAPEGKQWFRDLKIGAQFDFIGPTFASFHDRCEKISARKYKSITEGRNYGLQYTVGSINVCVYHVTETRG